ESKPLTVGNFSRIEYAPPGYLLFTRDRALMAQPFDAGSRRFTGDPVPVASDVQAELGGGNADYSVSANGVLTVRGARESATGRLVWMDRAGVTLGSMGEPGPYVSVELSPEGERAAVVVGSSGGVERDVWVIEGARGVASRLTAEQGADVWPVWSPDGSRVAFASNRSGVYSLVIKRADGTGSEEFLSPRPEGCGPHQWSPDGTFLVLGHNPGVTRWDISTLPLEPGAKSVPVLNGSHNESWGRISPDGKWLAYTSDESGRNEIYVRPVGSAVGKYQISTQGGFSMRWRRDGKEIFYVLGDGTMMAVDVRTEQGFHVGVPRTLFRAAPPQGFNGPQYSVAPDGQRFLVLMPERNSAASATTVVVNWRSMLRSD
ncbi:MAG TPA: hypothetical protein VK977_10495, partial [Actinomycetota bacterium]|nr:hypothetical protein [Actinomycetota bacterium]